jgi:hypothetical protein
VLLPHARVVWFCTAQHSLVRLPGPGPSRPRLALPAGAAAPRTLTGPWRACAVPLPQAKKLDEMMSKKGKSIDAVLDFQVNFLAGSSL